MSTPITDAAYDAVRSFTNEEQAVDALMEMRETSRNLERENAALKQRILDDNKAYGCELMDPSGTIWDHAKRLQQENAALRADKERLDWLNIHMECHCHDEDGFHSWLWVKAPATNKDLRAAIDAARKEAQP